MSIAEETADLNGRLQQSYWTLKRATGEVIAAAITFRPDGTIGGHSHPNEARWAFRDGHVELRDMDGRVSTRFDTVTLGPQSEFHLRGRFLLDGESTEVVHLLDEAGTLPARDGTSTRRRNLIILRAGNNSLHEQWIEGGNRNWDLMLSCYGDAVPASYADYIVMAKGPKWPPLHALILRNYEFILNYDYVCLADDDLLADCDTWNANFEICKAYDLWLAQPALTLDSFYSYQITLQQKNFLLRYTNFVELMCPIFSRRALQTCCSTMGQDSKYGWGQDFIWPMLLGRPRNRIAIIDGFPIKHTRPAGHNTDGPHAVEKMTEMFKAFGLAERPPMQIHGVMFPEAPDAGMPTSSQDFRFRRQGP